MIQKMKNSFLRCLTLAVACLFAYSAFQGVGTPLSTQAPAPETGIQVLSILCSSMLLAASAGLEQGWRGGYTSIVVIKSKTFWRWLAFLWFSWFLMCLIAFVFGFLSPTEPPPRLHEQIFTATEMFKTIFISWIPLIVSFFAGWEWAVYHSIPQRLVNLKHNAL